MRAVPLAALVFGLGVEVVHESDELTNGFLIGLASLLGGGELGLA